jgi:hypothetical protein
MPPDKKDDPVMKIWVPVDAPDSESDQPGALEGDPDSWEDSPPLEPDDDSQIIVEVDIESAVNNDDS